MTPPYPAGRRPAISHGRDLPADPDHPWSLGEALRRAAVRFPHAGIHVVAADGRTQFLDYPALLARARTVRAGLAARGLAHGSYAILRISSGAEFWPAFWGCALAGVVPLTTAAPRSYELDDPALAALLHAWRALDAPLVVAGTDDVDGLRHLPLGGQVVAVNDLAEPDAEGGPGDGGKPADGVEPGDGGSRPGRHADGGAPDELAGLAPETVALLQLSSGSTGTPKIIPLTHRGLCEYAVGAREMLDIRTGDVLLNWLPLDHSAGLLLYHVGGVFLGVSSVHVAPERVLADPLRWLELVRHHRVTHTWAPNFGLRLVADAVAREPERRWDLAAVRCVLSGGEQCLPETFQAFVDATGIPASAMTPAWGMAETTTAITFAPGGLPACLHRVRTASLTGDLEFVDDSDPDGCAEFISVGRPAPGATLRIVDGDDGLLPEGRIGRLQVRSARITPGYLGGPEADRAVFGDGGWLDTGDLAFMWEGRIAITGREKDIIVLNGHNQPCHDIEQVAGAVDGVAAGLVAACGVPDPRTGSECLVVFYVPAPEPDQPPHRVARAVTTAVSRRWQVAPTHVVAVPADQFPRTSGGKIQRRVLRDRFVAGELDPSAARTPTDRAPTDRPAVRTAVLDAVAEHLDGPVDPTRPFHELGVGSIGLIQIRARLEQFLGRPIPQPALFAHPTVEALTRHLTGSTADPTDRPTGPSADRDRRIAVIGMAARFPGAATVDAYWANLLAGVESIRFFDRDELVAAGVPRETVEAPEFVAASGVLDDIAGFDAGFFGISPREAELLDPQHRLFLEVCQHALEDAGYAGEHDGEQVGLFAGSGMNLYSHHTYLRNNLTDAAGSADPAAVMGSALGNQPDFLATRVAYRLGLTGPAINVQTACSTSLVAVHLAVRALLDGDADVAIAGAAAVHVPQVTGYRHTPGSILSANGRCRPFDADADGTVGGNGVAAVVLKPLARALADGDPVHAVILGSAVNNDGAGKVGFTAPGVAGQVDVVRRALRNAAVPAASIGFVEAHGTDTALGDPVEHHALAEAYATARPLLGSVKANIGHLDSCAGMAGLIRAVLSVRTGRIPPQINFTRPAADLDGSPFTITTSAVDWPGATPRRAAVSALGVGGTNTHLIVEQPPARAVPAAGAGPEGGKPALLPLSAADPAALADLAVRYRDHLRRHPDLRLPDLVLTTGRGRRQLRHRLVALGGSSTALASALDRYAAGLPAADVLVGDAATAGPGPIALAFPGQGDLRTVVLDLADRFPVVRDVLDRAGAAYRLAFDDDLLARLRDRPDASAAATDVAQPALVVTGVALAELWRSWGVTPDYVLGHSVGEYAALITAGALSLDDAVRLTAHRGRLMRDRVAPGAMVAVLAGRPVVDDLIAGSGLELAAVNGPGQHVVAGPADEIDALTTRAGRHRVPIRRLPVSRAFHSAAVEPMLAEFRALVGEVDLRAIRVPFVSTLDGRVREPGWRPDADYLCRQARATVDHHAAVRTLATRGCRTIVEAGADGVLTGIAGTAAERIAPVGAAHEAFLNAEPGATWVPSQRRDLGPADGLWRALAELHCAGVPVDWAAVAGDGAHRVPLPTYPFQHRTYWIDPPVGTGAGPAGGVRPVPATTGTGATHVLDRIRALAASKLGLTVAEVDPDETFFGLGADSLLLITVSREIEKAFGVRVPVRELFAALDTPRRLAEAVSTSAPSVDAPAPASPGRAEPAAARSPWPAEPAAPQQPVARSLAAEPAVRPDTVPRELAEIIHRQLDLMGQQLALLRAATTPAAGPATEPASRVVPPAATGATEQPTPDEIAPLSPGQRRLWLIEQLHPGTPAYTDAVAVRLRGALDVPALRGALHDVVDRHAPLRTVYREVDGEPCQVVRARTPVRLPVRDHAGQDEDDMVREVLAAESRRVFDLGAGPVFAFTLLRFSATHHVLVMTFHHLSTDGGSYTVLTREVSACYRARLAGTPAHLPPLPTTYPELSRARYEQHQDAGEKALRYWLTRLDPPPPTLSIPSDLTRPALPAATGRSVFDEIPADLTARLQQLSRARRVTPFTTLLSAFGVVLFQYSGQPDLIVGTGSTGRDEATQDLIGFFVDTLPLRLDLSGDPTFGELLARVQSIAADGYDHADVPFDALVRALAPDREAGRHPLFDVAIEYETGGAFAFDLPGVTAEPLRVGLDKAPVDLMVHLTHGDTVTCHVEYRTEVFDPVTVRRILDRLHRVLDEVTRDPHVPLSRLVDEPTVRWGASVPPSNDRLHELFTRQSARTPQAVAVVAGETRWTYRDLHDRADATARRIRAAGIGADDIVAVCLLRRPELIAAQLGVLMAGAAFLPLDPELPPARVAALLADSGARLLVATAGVDHPTGVPRLLVEEPTPAHLPAPAAAPAPEHLAWCVHTSGSTGAPKAVAVPHRAAVDTVTWHARALALTGADAVAHGLGLGFDANLAEIYPALAAGATIHLVPSQARSDPARLRDWWARSGITVAFLPTPLAELVFALPTPPAGTLRVLVVGGSQLRRRPPAGFPARVLNAYGPTENTIVTTAGPVTPDGTGPIDIGEPVDNRRVYLLDPRGRPVPPGAAGELHVGGGGLARGYLGRPADTSAVFVPDPYSPTPGAVMYRTGDRVRLRGDGTLEFLGRLDDQVKIAGHRVEPGEAGTVLALLPGVRQATVVARHDRGDDPYLAAYVVPETDTESPADRATRLTGALVELLPAYLVPRAWVTLDALPTTDTGKIDTARLPAPAVDTTGPQARTENERLLHDAWCAELGVPRLPLDVPFFASGGHSLAAVRLANRLTDLLGSEVGVHRILRAPGIRAMAASLAADLGLTDEVPHQPEEPADGDGPAVEDRAPATYQQETMWHRQRVAPNPAAVHMSVRVALTGRLDVPALRAALDGVVARHEALRTRVVERDGAVVQEVLAHRTLPLPVDLLDAADVDAAEVEAWCVATGREPFPADGPWLHARLAPLAGDRWVLIMIVHHLCGDGWSMAQLLREIEEGYRAALAGRTPVLEVAAIRYADHARRQRGTKVPEAVLRYWRDHLAGAPRSVPLPTDRPRPATISGRGAEYAFDVPAAVTGRLHRLADELGTGLFPVLASGYALLAARLTGVRDIVLACPYAHRDSRDTENVVGLFTSPMLLRPSLDAPCFADLVTRTHTAFLDAIRHQPAPLPAVYAAVDPGWRPGMTPPVASTLFAWNPRIPSLRLPDVTAEVADQGLACARRDYTTVITPVGDGLRGVVEYSTDLFDEATVAAWCADFVALLATAAANPHATQDAAAQRT
ncbi:non-ribosomal peptide synthetase/type I polyketide synthase [Micromonospora peucetia]|uniref:Amino acid adenylation domain-containing protein n=1 Tax=Micromonospora peucetia TaxID=47871 RepID=A0ABZ1EA51_9ACTN|nr:non-ribosomal peptide synthetase/type I polyketide synthase [Micromonospora peucetia]WSA31035.1 amino acid adenylation domain-containing protein [Micromonospora peucetia]